MKRCIFILLLSAMTPVFGQSARLSPAAFSGFAAQTIQHQSVSYIHEHTPSIATVNPDLAGATAGVVVQEELIAGKKWGLHLKNKSAIKECEEAKSRREKRHPGK